MTSRMLRGGGGGDGKRRGPLPSRGSRVQGLIRRLVHGRRRHWMLVSVLSFWLAIITLALPLGIVNADANSLGAYDADASAWAIQPYALNNKFSNVPLDQAAPMVFVHLDNSPKAKAKASYFFPGTAANAVPASQGVSTSIPTGVEADYPGDNGSVSGQVGGFNDGIASQAAAGSQSAKTSEGYALAQSALASYQFAPAIPAAPTAPGVPGVPGVPTVPPLPTTGVAAPTATASSGTGGASPTPTKTPTCILIICSPTGYMPAHGGVNASPAMAFTGLPTFPLPDTVERQLTASLAAAQVKNPSLLALSGGHLASTNPALPYAQADASSQAESRATDNGVTVTVVTRASHVELFQGLIEFASVQANLQGFAPGNGARGKGTVNTIVTGATVAGIPVTIDRNGVTVQDKNASASQIQTLTNQLNAALAQAHVRIGLMDTTMSSNTGLWQGAGSGVEVTVGLAPPSTSLPQPVQGTISGLPATKIDFTIAAVSASILAYPSNASPGSGGSGSSGSGGSGSSGSGGFCLFGCGGGGGGGGSSTSTTSPGATTHSTGTFTLPGGLHGFPLLAMVFVVQGLSTAAVAATAGFTDGEEDQKEAPVAEEETK